MILGMNKKSGWFKQVIVHWLSNSPECEQDDECQHVGKAQHCQPGAALTQLHDVSPDKNFPKIKLLIQLKHLTLSFISIMRI